MHYLLHHLLRRSAEEHPDRTAVIDRDRSMTYSALEQRASQVANLLLDVGVSRGDRVGVYLDKSLESVVGIYAVLKAGAAYVPFDPQAPAPRLGYMARDCGVEVLITGEEKSGSWSRLVDEGAPLDRLVVLNGGEEATDGPPTSPRVFDSSAMDAQSTSAPDGGAIDQDPAYILYTSGSTGSPKGVTLTHRNALSFVDWAVRCFGIRPDDRLSNHAPFHFDLSILDLYAAAEAGAAVVLVPPETAVFPIQVARFIDGNEITIWYSVPSILSMLVLRGGLRPGSFPHLRKVLFAGEVFPTKYLRRLMELLPHAEFFNLYGPTETNACTYFQVPPLPQDETAPIPIGAAIDNVEVFALSGDGARARPGEVGELWVRGATVMQGYWGDAERTASVLVPAPDGSASADLAYRTGDLVRQAEDGNYLLLGRRDHQIKSRGYRIELGEIEAALYAHPGVLECAVVAVPDDIVTNRIRAFVVPREGTGLGDLARACAERLPRYMIPEAFTLLHALPKTSTGKVDRQELASLRERNDAEATR